MFTTWVPDESGALSRTALVTYATPSRGRRIAEPVGVCPTTSGFDPAQTSIPLERWQSLSARGLCVDLPVFLAPMVGLSHAALRRTVQSYVPTGASTLTFTEMLSSRRLPTERVGATPETARHISERGLVPQLLANEERFIAASIQRLRALNPAAIDINMGCPVTRALRHNWGVALMGDPKYAEDVVRMTVRHSPWPVSVKIRTGFDDDAEYLLDFARMLEAAGASWISVHPRTASAGRRGRAQWDHLARVRDAVAIPVVGNGDVQTCEDALTLLRRTGCDGVMIGRAATARPWLVWQIGEALGWPAPPSRSSECAPRDGLEEGLEYPRALGLFLDTADGLFPPAIALRRARFLTNWSGRWLEFGHEFWKRVTRCEDTTAIRAVAGGFFAGPIRMFGRTELRS